MKTLYLSSAVLLSCLSFVSAKQKALLVGINNYKNPKNNLYGCHNDIHMIKKLLVSQFGFKEQDIIMLKDSAATTSNIKQKFKDHLIKGTSKNDSVVFYFSGHGTLVPDFNGDEKDGKDEVIVSYDFNPRVTSSWFTDDVMNSLIQRLPTQKAWISFDCCHSGTANRSIRPQTVPKGAKSRFLDFGFQEIDEAALTKYHQSRSLSGKQAKEASQHIISKNVSTKHTFTSACQSYQVAWESAFTGQRNGIFTTSIVASLQDNPHMTLGEMQTQVNGLVGKIATAIKKDQRPYFTLTGRNIKFSQLLDGFSEGVVPHQPPSTNIAEFNGYKPKGDIKVNINLNKQLLKVGENLRLQVTASKDCYLRVYHYSAENKVTLIYPNPYQKDNYIKANTPTLLPPKGGSFQFTMQKPTGNEIIKAVVSSTQFSDLAATNNFTNYQDINLNTASNRGTSKNKKGYGENIAIYTITE